MSALATDWNAASCFATSPVRRLSKFLGGIPCPEGRRSSSEARALACASSRSARTRASKRSRRSSQASSESLPRHSSRTSSSYPVVPSRNSATKNRSLASALSRNSSGCSCEDHPPARQSSRRGARQVLRRASHRTRESMRRWVGRSRSWSLSIISHTCIAKSEKPSAGTLFSPRCANTKSSESLSENRLLTSWTFALHSSFWYTKCGSASHSTAKKSSRDASARASGFCASPQSRVRSDTIVSRSLSTGVVPSQSRRMKRRSGRPPLPPALPEDGTRWVLLLVECESRRCASKTVLRRGRFAALNRPTSCIHMLTMSTSVKARQNSADFPSKAFWSSFSRPSVPSTSSTSVWLSAARAHQIPLVV
mmetsp:Transcript_40045/g.94941  ORF Transcript_40045/g.94941 Transcript_40045/m.94941 type:complete len:366 (+) Transcript_40045:627-1724(+)